MARSVTLKGTPFNLAGSELKVGDKAPDATLKKDLVTSTRLSETGGKNRVISVVPSLDTPVCAAQTKRFHEEAGKLPAVEFMTISADLPMAQKRFCGAEGIDGERMRVLSDTRGADFGQKWGTFVPDLGIECRAVFVVDKSDKIRFAEYVPEIANHPNYDAVLSALKSL